MSTPQKPPIPAVNTPAEDQEEERLDEAEDESFPASDPNSETQPRPIRR